MISIDSCIGGVYALRSAVDFRSVEMAGLLSNGRFCWKPVGFDFEEVLLGIYLLDDSLMMPWRVQLMEFGCELRCGF
jgi:hypothetical protein